MRKISEILAAFNALPAANAETVLNGQRALILAPHADDESLACGGLIAAACEMGVAPIVAVLTDGSASHPGSRAYPPYRLGVVREAEVRDAVSRLGLPRGHLIFLRYKDTELPASGHDFEAACTNVEVIASRSGCQLLVAPWHGDPHCDHQAAALIADAVAMQRGLRLLSYPVWGWLRDGADLVSETRRAGWRLDISAHLLAKHKAIAAHASQYGDLITDSPNGFKLPSALLAVFARSFEVYIA
jgi:LmbE family N-acetylglucosaminyl deacetylase